MPPVTILDIEKICCVCLRIELNMNLIFKSGGDTPTIAEMLSELTIYKIQPSDELPHLICNDCTKVVISAFQLKRHCEISYRTLMGLLKCEKDESQLNSCCPKDLLEKSTQTEESSMFPCERCEETFFSFEKLRVHRHTAHKGAGNICRFCSRSFTRITDLKIHLALVHPESGYKQRYECHICQRQFMCKRTMQKHLNKVHKWEDNDMETSKKVKKDKKDKKKVKSSLKTDITPEIAIESESVKNLYHLRQEDNLEDLTEVEVNKHLEIKIDEDEKPLVDFITYSAASSDIKPNITIESESESDKNLYHLRQEDNLEDLTEVEVNKHLEIKIDEDEKPLVDFINYSAASSAQLIEGNDNKFKQELTMDEDEKPLGDLINSSAASSTQTSKDVFNKSIMEDDIPSNSKNVQEKCSYLGRPLKIRPTCKYCDKSYDDLFILLQHIATQHIELHDFPCKICGHTLKTEDDYQKHFITNHSDKPRKKPYVCRACSQDFDKPDELRNHAKKEHNKPLLCTLCGLRCRSEDHLAIHIRRHTGEKPFKCQFCSKGFPRIDDVKIHEKYHTDEKSHYCDICGKGFVRAETLKIHLRIHTGEKPFKCTFCPRAFIQSNDLKTHIRRHTGERFLCDICGAEFLQAYKLRRHKIQEHDIHDVPPTQRVKKFLLPEKKEKQNQQNLKNP